MVEDLTLSAFHKLVHIRGLDHGRFALIRLHNSFRGIPASDGKETQGKPAKSRKPRN